MSTTKGGPNIVTDSLIFVIDAKNPNSQVSGDTTTYNLKDRDVSGTLTNGTVANGNTWDFDGVNDVIDFNSPIVTTGDKSAFVWINPTVNKNWSMIISNSIGLSSNGHGFEMYTTLLGQFTISIGDDSGDGSSQFLQTITPTSSIEINKWICVGFVQDNNQLFAYINGVEASSDLTSSNTESTPDYNLRVGTRNAGLDHEFTGQISNVKIYNRALTASEVSQNYNTLKTRFGH